MPFYSLMGPIRPATRRSPPPELDPEHECALWEGYVDAQGYPRRRVAGRTVYAHRHEWERWHGELKPGQRVYRVCGQRDCVAIRHMTLERPSPRRKPKRPASAKLSPKKVRAIRAAWREPDRPTQRELAKKYRVSRSAISLVLRGETWRDV